MRTARQLTLLAAFVPTFALAQPPPPSEVDPQLARLIAVTTR